MRSAGKSRAVVALFVLSSCFSSQKNKSLPDFFDKPDVKANYFISVFNQNDCMMCYGAIGPRFFSLLDSFNIPKENTMAYFPSARKKEIDYFFTSILSTVKRTHFGTLISNDKELDATLRKHHDYKPNESSYYIILSPDQKLLKKGIYKYDP